VIRTTKKILETAEIETTQSCKYDVLLKSKNKLLYHKQGRHFNFFLVRKNIEERTIYLFFDIFDIIVIAADGDGLALYYR